MLAAYSRLLVRYNQKINLISRDDEKRVALHIRHAIGIAIRRFPPGSTVVDWGTGGGLPALPLAICFPEVRFCGVDTVKKKTMALQTMVRRLRIGNLEAWNGRAEEWPGVAQYSVSRATAPLPRLWQWHLNVATQGNAQPNSSFWKPGLVCLKGGDLGPETEALCRRYPSVSIEQHPLQPILDDAYFAEKYIIAVSAPNAVSER